MCQALKSSDILKIILSNKAMNNPQFSFFKGGITQTKLSQNIDIEAVNKILVSDVYKNQVQKIRLEKDVKAQRKLKEKLHYVTFSGVFSERKEANLITESGLICLDFDKIEDLEKVKKELAKDKFCHLHFVSPSGNGLKLIIKISEFKNAWLQLADYFKVKYGLEADKSGKDICRACFLSWDIEAVYNPDSKIFVVKEIIPKLEKTKNQADFDRAKLVVERIVSKGLDLTEDYNDWLNLGFALAGAFREEGRAIFHDISKFYSKYSIDETDTKFEECLKNTRFDNAAFLFKKAKEAGIPITKNEEVHQNYLYRKNKETESNGSVTYDLQDFRMLVQGPKYNSVVSEGFLLYIKYMTVDENEYYTWILEVQLPDASPIYLEIGHDDFFEPKNLEKILGAKRLSITCNYTQLQKIRTFLFNCTPFPKAKKVIRYGLHPETELFMFANCAISKQGKIYYPDRFGIIDYNGMFVSMPQVNKNEDSPFKYSDNLVTFNEWFRLFAFAQKHELAFLGASFMLFSIFRDVAIQSCNFSPMLFLTGIAGTNKSTFFKHLNFIFGTDGQAMGINLKGRNSEAGFTAKLEQRYCGFIFGDEYIPNHNLTPLFQASYDNKAYTKSNMNSKMIFDTIDLVPKCAIGFASNYLPTLPDDEPFFSRLVLIVNNNRQKTEEQSQAYRRLCSLQEAGITNILKEIWTYRDYVKTHYSTTYQTLKGAMELYFEKYKIGNPRYIFNLAQILTVPYMLCIQGKILMTEATTEADILEEFIKYAEVSIIASDRIAREKSHLREFFDIVQELFERNQILEGIHFRFLGPEVIINLHRIYSKFSTEFKKINRFETLPPPLYTLMDEILSALGLDSNSEIVKNNFFRKVRFKDELEPSKTDFARNTFKMNYLDLQKQFGLDLISR
jgi:hypothetical protein